MNGAIKKAAVLIMLVLVVFAGVPVNLAFAEEEGAHEGQSYTAKNLNDRYVQKTEALNKSDGGDPAVPVNPDNPDTTTAPPPTNLPASNSAADIVAGMTTEQKITQCLMMDFRKWNNSEGSAEDMTSLNPDVAEIISQYQFGSIILFANNIKKTDETLNLTKDMQEAAVNGGGLPLLIATDQEGGVVYRLGSGTALPGNMALGATGDVSTAETSGEIIGRELSAVGINTTLAPVIDVNNNANNPVIGTRSFGDDADMVAEFGSAFIKGVTGSKTIACAKHFPGHGDTGEDSHYGLPVIDKSLDELRALELEPFQAAIDGGVDMIMTAHILFPRIDSNTIPSEKTGKNESRPATMSKVILTDLLRDDMGFNGVVVTDAMNMNGVANNFSPEQSALEAIKAGADIICMPITGIHNMTEFTDNIDAVISYIKDAVDNGDLSEERLNEAATRVLELKKKRGILDYDPADYSVEEAEATVGSDKNRDLEHDMAIRAVTLIRNDNNILPYKASEKTKILMMCPYNNERALMVMGLNRAKEAGKVPAGAEVKVYRFSADDHEVKDGGELKAAIDWADLVIINSEVTDKEDMSFGYYTSVGVRNFTQYCKKSGKHSVVLSVDKPYDVQLYPDADAVLAVYGCKGTSLDVTRELIDGEITKDENACGPNITAGVEVLFGLHKPTGKLPVSIPKFVVDESGGHFTDNILYKRTYGLTYEDEPPKPAPPKPAPPAKPKAKQVLVAKGIAKGSKSVALSWNKVSGADRYVIYFSRCNYKGKKYKFKKIKTLKSGTLKFTKKKLKKKTAYKFYVVAQKKSGGKYKTIAKSRHGHFFTGNVRGRYTNPKSLKLNKSKISLKKGKSTTIKGSVSKARKNKKLATTHAARLRFTSNNPKVAAVNSKGKVTAGAKGTAVIYVQTINGIWKTCKITVK